jgi:hypothetical protein
MKVSSLMHQDAVTCRIDDTAAIASIVVEWDQDELRRQLTG